VAEVEVDEIPTAPEPPVTVPFTFRTEAPVSEMPALAAPVTEPVTVIVIAVVDRMPIPDDPTTEPDILTVGDDVRAIPAAGLVVLVAPDTDPVIISVVPEKFIPTESVPPPLLFPPNIFPITVKLPAVWFIPKLVFPDVLFEAFTLPIIIVLPADAFNPWQPVIPPIVAVPETLPLTIIVPVEDLFIHTILLLIPPIKLLPVRIKSHAPECSIACVPTPVTVALGALIFTVPVVAVTVIRFVAPAVKPAATLALTFGVLKLNVPPDKLPAPEPVDSVSSSSFIAGGLPPANVIFIL